jgi:hypothetical protein
MSAATSHLDKFARSLCWSSAGPSIAHPYAQTIKPKPRKIRPHDCKDLIVATASVAHCSPRLPRQPPTASPAARKSP